MKKQPSPRVRKVVWTLSTLVMLFLALQVVRPDLNNPPVRAELHATDDVKQVLRASCYNCHSNETKLSWFDYPVPAIWLVAKDVKSGRARLNFSELGAQPEAQQRATLYECVSQVELGAMPPPKYQRLHAESAMTAEKLNVLKNYLNPLPQSVGASVAQMPGANEQYEKWLPVSNTLATAAPSPNGIAFLSDYKNWRAISSTERDDNLTLRQILGNDIAIRAVEENRINPWPDGTAFAKVAWFQQTDDSGIVRPGAFYQVEFMIRDGRKYASTLGWGWARWRGTELKPYGQNKNFAQECVGCHRPLKATDYVFTMPLRRLP